MLGAREPARGLLRIQLHDHGHRDGSLRVRRRPSALGAAHALNAAGAVAGSLLVASLGRTPSRSTLALCCAVTAIAICGNAIAPSLLSFLLWAPVFGLSLGAYQTALLISVQRAAEPRMLGRVSGLLALGSAGAIPIASLIAGWMTDVWSARAAMGLGAAACAIGAVFSCARPVCVERRRNRRSERGLLSAARAR